MTDKKKYSKEDIDGLLQAFEVYLLNPEEVRNSDVLKKYVPNYEKKHTDLFVKSVELGASDIKDFAEGRLEIAPDAILSMEKYIETFGKEQINGKYQYTPEALKALDRIKDLKKQELSKNNSEKTLNSFLIAKHEIENNPRMSEGQKTKEIEKLTTAARHKMQNSKHLSEEDLKVAPLFIAAFGYDKGNAINKIARDFQNKVEKQQKDNVVPSSEKVKEETVTKTTIQKEKDDVIVIPVTEHKKEEKKEEKKEKKEKKSFWQKVKSGLAKTAKVVKDSFKYWFPVFAIAGASGNLEIIKVDKQNTDNDNPKHKKEILAKQSKENKQDKENKKNKDLDISLLTQCAKRLGFQNKISAEDATKLTMQNLDEFSKLSKTTKAKIAGKTDLEKLSKLVVVRGDQPKLKQDIDNLIKGKKVAPDILKDIADRTTKVTDDFSANKDNSLKTSRQSLDMSAYLFVKDQGNSK